MALYDNLSNSYPDYDWSSWLPEHDGTIMARGRQWTSHDRTGLDLSNQIKLADTLQLMLGVNYQREKLNDRVEQTNLNLGSGGLGIDGNTMHASTDFFGPRSGERKEYSATMNLSYQPTSWLTLTAGTRYMRYTGKDTGLAKIAGSRVKTGMQLEYGEILTTEEAETIINFWNTGAILSQAAEPYMSDFYQNGIKTPEVEAYLANRQAQSVFLDGRQANYRSIDDSGNAYLYWEYDDPILVPVINGKPDSSQNPFANGTMNAAETVENTQGLDEVARYATGIGEDVYETLSSGQAWENSAEQSGHAWSPVLSATARIGQFGTGFARYAQTTRFPSVYELTSSSVVDGAGTLGTLIINGASKPERSTNIEIGYAHNLTQFFPGMALADARISYYNTRIKNFIDRTAYADTIQFAKKKTSGIELQSRFDSGRFFGGLGGTYRLKQEMCDKDFASSMDPYYNRIPTCMTGGFPGTYSGSSLQPKYSINMELGTRLLDRRLEVGWRGTYHAGAENRQLDRLLAQSTATPGTATLPRDVWFRGGVDALYWQSVVLHDLYAQFQVNKSVLLNLNIINLTDQYYMDPMSKNVMPGPGRTITAGMTLRF